MADKRTCGKLALEPKTATKPPISVTEVRQEALENFAGSIAQVTSIANGECFVSLKKRCEKCGAEPGPELAPAELLRIVPRPSDITQANALLAKISLPAQTEDLSLAEGRTLIEATLGRYRQLALNYGVPVEVVMRWFEEALAPLSAAS